MSRRIELIEHQPKLIPAEALSQAEGDALYATYGKYVKIEYPGPPTGGMWRLTSEGYVGAVATRSGLDLVIRPKVPIRNLARMIQVANDLSAQFFPGLTLADTILDLYDHLVRALSRAVVHIARQGLHHEYRSAVRDLSAVRGRMHVGRLLGHPEATTVRCTFSHRTCDVPENQLIAFALRRTLRSGLCSAAVQAEARNAYRLFSSDVDDSSIGYESLEAISYTRLTERYQPAHALARLLIESSGPIAEVGETTVVPFLVDMPALFETFVAKWLGQNAGPAFVVDVQKYRPVGDSSDVPFYIDLVLRRTDGSSACVLDTKYKDSRLPTSADVAQIGQYALLEKCSLAGLVVPIANRSWRGKSGHIETFRTAFDLNGDLDTAGLAFLAELKERIDIHEAHDRASQIIS